uniref:Ccar1, putative n=1 Tax=Ixodes scapularis TaxID=6945 RepID=A0A1S4M362_IXOSC
MCMQAGLGLATTPANLTYPTQARILGAPPTGVPAPGPAPSAKQRVFTGTVTKLHDNFGFVDEDVFFQTSAIKGTMPKVGERVLVEASYNQNMPFKWNAYRIQLLANQMNAQVGVRLGTQTSAAGNQANTSATMAAQTQYINSITSGKAACATLLLLTQTRRPSSPTPMRRAVSPAQLRRDRDMRHDDRRDRYQDRNSNRDFDRDRRPYNRMEDRTRDRFLDRNTDRNLDRNGSGLPRKHALSPSRRGSSPPPRRKPRLMPRYVVDIPAISLDQCEMGVVDLKKRYPNLYIPSDFFHANICWQRAFPLHRPFSLNHPCGFQAPPAPPPPPAVLNPPDLDFSFSAKVMLLSAPALEELYQQSCALAEESEEGRLGSMHPARILSFLVGLKGKSETVALGGPWSPSLDGPNPSSDPRVLIRTAVRTCRALTGIDLSACTQWYRFAEICYRRESSSSSCATLERVVLFFPDVWRCMPTRQEWADLELRLRSISLCGTEDPAGDAPAQALDTLPTTPPLARRCCQLPTHPSEPACALRLQVGDLRTELEARGLLTKGLKSQLVARLAKALKAEAEQEEEEEEEEVEEEAEEMEEGGEVVDEANEEEEEVEAVEEEAPESEPEEEKPRPTILVYPSRKAKGGRFDCSVMSLSVLLDYRQEDNKEHSFEVSLFAELFNEMLIRDCAFNIYRALLEAPEPKEVGPRALTRASAPSRETEFSFLGLKCMEKKKEKESTKDADKKGDRRDDRKTDRRPDRRERKVSLAGARDDEEKKADADQEDSDGDSEASNADAESEETKGAWLRSIRRRQKKEAKQQNKTVNKHLLLSFIYFDQNQCGYVLERDLEDIFYIIGLKLSRGQVRRLLQKVSKREVVRYRSLTDAPVCPEEMAEEQEEEEADEEMEEEAQLCGNNVCTRAGVVPVEVTSGGPTASNMVFHEGAILDVAKLLRQVERSERARTSSETRLKEVME